MIAGEKNIEMYRKMIEQTKRKIEIIDFEINDVHKNKILMKYYTKSLFWFVGIVGFAIGYWLGWVDKVKNKNITDNRSLLGNSFHRIQ